MTDHLEISQEVAHEMLAALQEIADFPNAPSNRDLTFSTAVRMMSEIADLAILRAKVR